MKLIAGLFVFVAVVLLLTAGHAGIARTPDAQSAAAGLGDVPEVVVTADRPEWLMPEVVVRANWMPEVVVHSSWVQAPVASSAPSTFTIN